MNKVFYKILKFLKIKGINLPIEETIIVDNKLMDIQEGKILLIDGMNLINRAYFANMELKSKDGVPSGALYGFVEYLQLLEKVYKPSCMFVALDRSRNTFRRDIYPDYKAQRKPTVSDLKMQFKFAKKYLELANIKWLDSETYEADDILATLSRTFSESKLSPYIISGDRDSNKASSM